MLYLLVEKILIVKIDLKKVMVIQIIIYNIMLLLVKKIQKQYIIFQLKMTTIFKHF